MVTFGEILFDRSDDICNVYGHTLSESGVMVQRIPSSSVGTVNVGQRLSENYQNVVFAKTC